MAQDSDPVGSGFVASLARPGGNITVLSTLSPELSGKRLELLKEVVPSLSRVAVFGTSAESDNAKSLKEIELAAGAFGVKVQYLDVLDPKNIEPAFRAAAKGPSWRSPYDGVGPAGEFSATTDCGTRSKEPAPSDMEQKIR